MSEKKPTQTWCALYVKKFQTRNLKSVEDPDFSGQNDAFVLITAALEIWLRNYHVSFAHRLFYTLIFRRTLGNLTLMDGNISINVDQES